MRIPSRFFGSSVLIIGATAATTPASQSQQSGTTVIIPVPAGVLNGDHLFAVTRAGFSQTMTPPAGWSEVLSITTVRVWYRVADSEPADYTWTQGTTDIARSGCMVAVRGGSLGSALIDSNDLICPDVTSLSVGSLWLGFTGYRANNNIADTTASAGKHVLLAQHTAENVTPGTNTVCVTAVSFISGLDTDETVTGQAFADGGALATTLTFRIAAAVIINR